MDLHESPFSARLGLCAALLTCAGAVAAGPDTVAAARRDAWPEPLDSPAAYDRASRAEILVFAAALAERSRQPADVLARELRLKNVDAASVRRVGERLRARLVQNYRLAAATCGAGDAFCGPHATADELERRGAGLDAQLAPAYRPWLAQARRFHHDYAGELIRLAALFPRVSSEIDLFSALERDGSERADGEFQLTFDDGPTAPGGSTDALLERLREHDLHATFFVLGESLAERSRSQGAAGLRALYAGQCVALHGWRHVSHQSGDGWQQSVERSDTLTRTLLPDAYRPWFRPPYGQRRPDSGAFFAAQGLGVALWNIDSLDWNARVSAQDAGGRVLTLMLLWRRGTILFHDVHRKAAVAVPWLVAQTRASGIRWQDCRADAAPAANGR